MGICLLMWLSLDSRVTTEMRIKQKNQNQRSAICRWEVLITSAVTCAESVRRLFCFFFIVRKATGYSDRDPVSEETHCGFKRGGLKKKRTKQKKSSRTAPLNPAEVYLHHFNQRLGVKCTTWMLWLSLSFSVCTPPPCPPPPQVLTVREGGRGGCSSVCSPPRSPPALTRPLTLALSGSTHPPTPVPHADGQLH